MARDATTNYEAQTFHGVSYQTWSLRMMLLKSNLTEFRPCGTPYSGSGFVARVQLIEEYGAAFEARELELI